MAEHPMTRREVLGGLTALAGLGLTACSSSPTLEILGTAISGLRNIGKPAAYGASDAQIEALPYASLGVRIGNAAPAIMILARIDGDELHWASADRIVFVTQRGRLVKTVGLPRDLVATQWAGPDPLTGFGPARVLNAGHRVARFIDLRPNDDFNVPVESSFEVVGEETLALLGKSHECLRLREHIRVRKWRWSTDNLFWVDKLTGRVWKSRQQFSQDSPAMTLEVLKPAAEVLPGT